MSDAATAHLALFEATARRDFVAIRNLYHDDYAYTGGDGIELTGPDAGIAVLETYTTAFPDLEFTIRHHHVPSPGVSIIESHARGTHKEELQGIPATGRVVELDVCNVIHMRDGKIYRERDYYDALSMLQQLGVAPTEPATEGTPGLDILEALGRGHEERNALILADLYAAEAEIQIVDNTRPPKAPQTIKGQEAILEFLVDICGRDMTHQIESEVVGGDRIAYRVACEYSDGTKVLTSQIADLSDGKIIREVILQAWDT